MSGGADAAEKEEGLTMGEARMSDTPPLVIVHGSCRDGFCAAWVARRKLPTAEIVHAYYGKEPPDVRGRDVVLIDFSYPRATLRAMRRACESLLVIDHHKSAAADLAEDTTRDAITSIAGWSNLSWERHCETVALDHLENAEDQIYTLFDMERSGAGLAWDFFSPGEPRPWLVDYVEDRDLWRHALPFSEIINAYVGLLPFEFATWSEVATRPMEAYCEAGSIALTKTEQYVAEASKNLRWCTVAGYRVPVVNAPQVDISELLDAVLTRQVPATAVIAQPDVPFAVGWWQRFDGLFQYSLRSRGDFDVSEIAKQFGGGGHRNAAGFQSATLVHA